MTRFKASVLPPHADIYKQISPGDFLDCYSCETDIGIKDAAKRAMTLPRWAGALMRLRNTIMAPLGMKTGTHQGNLTPSSFPITYESDTEIQLGLNDKHLNFRVTVMRHQGRIYLSTWVHVHNFMGTAYLTLVMPFHRLIVHNRMSDIARN